MKARDVAAGLSDTLEAPCYGAGWRAAALTGTPSLRQRLPSLIGHHSVARSLPTRSLLHARLPYGVSSTGGLFCPGGAGCGCKLGRRTSQLSRTIRRAQVVVAYSLIIAHRCMMCEKLGPMPTLPTCCTPFLAGPLAAAIGTTGHQGGPRSALATSTPSGRPTCSLLMHMGDGRRFAARHLSESCLCVLRSDGGWRCRRCRRRPLCCAQHLLSPHGVDTTASCNRIDAKVAGLEGLER